MAGRKEFDQIYKDTVDLLQNLGWPKFPPKEIPRTHDWWKTSRTEYPRSCHLPGSVVLDLAGSPKAGKTTIGEAVTTNRSTWHYWSEPHTIGQSLVFDARTSLLMAPMIDDEVFPVLLEKDDWMSSIFLKQQQVSYWSAEIESLIKKGSKEEQSVILASRGPMDIMCFLFAFAVHKIDPVWTIPDWYKQKDGLKIMRPSLAVDFSLFSKIEAVVLFGVSQEVAQERRKLEGKTSPGWVTDSPFFKDLSAWYGYFIEYVWPKLHEYYGTGLLVLNGEAEKQTNVEILTNYVDEILKKKG